MKTRSFVWLCLSLFSLVSAVGSSAENFDPAVYARRVYLDVLYRDASAPEVASAVADLQSGAPPRAFARSLLQSQERRALQISDDINRFLHRPANGGDYRDGLALFAQGASSGDIIAIILSSPEYAYFNGGSASSLGYAFYRDLLERAPTAIELQNVYFALQSGPVRQIPVQMLHSTEYATKLISSWYRAYLRREADAPGLQSWLQALAGGMSWEEAQAGFLASPEYLARPPGLAGGRTDFLN